MTTRPKKSVAAPSLATELDAPDILKAMREVLGLSREEFSAKVGMKRQQLSAYENRHHSPGVDKLAEIAAKAGVRIKVIVEASGGAKD